MRSFLRSLAPFVAVPLFLGMCLCIYSGNPVHAASSSDRADAGSSRVGAAASPLVVSVPIPGPLRSFLRMAGISQEAPLDDVLPLLSRNTYLLGYEEDTQTEFLRLLNRYLHQARELQIL